MRTSLRLPVKVVVSLLILFASLELQAQVVSMNTRERGTAALSSKLDEMEHAYAIHFVYSTEVVNKARRVANFNLSGGLDEDLQQLATATGLSIKRVGNHVVLKQVKLIAKPRPEATPVVYPEDEVVVLANEEGISTASLVDGQAPDWKHDLAQSDEIKYPTFQLTAQQVKRLNSKFYLAAGVYANDRAETGVEVGVGLKHFFALVGAERSFGGDFHMTYGLGTVIGINKMISLYPSWRISDQYRVEDITLTNGQLYFFFKDGQAIETTTNQFKLLGRFRVSPRLDIQVGPTINLVKTTHYYTMPDVIMIPTNAYSSNGRGSFVPARTPEDYS